MARWRQAIELAMTAEEIGRLTTIARSRSETARRVQRAQILLTYQENPSFFAVGQTLGVHHQTVQRCVERAIAYGPLAALEDRPRPPTITPEAKAWLISLACEKAEEHGYPHELWTTRLLARHARENAPAAGHECLANLVQGTVCKILAQEEVKPHKVRYYLECRDAEFEQKMAEVLCVYREVQVLKKTACRLSGQHRDQVDPRQSFRAHLTRNQSLARHSTSWSLRVHVHAQTRLLAQPHRGFLLQVRPLGSAPHPRYIKAGAQGAHHGRHRGR
jgi:transposase